MAAELCDGVAEPPDVDGVAAGPATPQVDCFDLTLSVLYPVDGVAEAGGLVVTIQSVACLLDAGSGLVELLHARGGALTGPLAILDSALRTRLGNVDFSTGGPASAQPGPFETPLRIGAPRPSLIGTSGRRVERVALRRSRGFDDCQLALGESEFGGESSPPRLTVDNGPLGCLQVAPKFGP
jgi:hypothetical protein